ncbi:hypothetical protein [Vibrio caribbeanicus]|uniref:hypothetical protein n=1 Tax=Vibrio caribbeanicus TaxID=701175 RepID=UPI0030DA64EF
MKKLLLLFFASFVVSACQSTSEINSPINQVLLISERDGKVITKITDPVMVQKIEAQLKTKEVVLTKIRPNFEIKMVIKGVNDSENVWLYSSLGFATSETKNSQGQVYRLTLPIINQYINSHKLH